MSADWISVTAGMLRVRGLPMTYPLSSACTGEMVGIHYFSLNFPQLGFMKVTYFPKAFYFLPCDGIYLEFLTTII